MSAIEAREAAGPVAAASAGRWSRWSDRLNPILVREVQQAVKGRVFVLTVFAALTLSVVIAVAVVGDVDAGESAGRNAFSAGLATLVPLLIFVVPMQAYQSMRLELRSGIVEQLLLSRLRPRSIVAGKLLAAMVQFLLYVSILAPLLATSYLLRGVDLPTIALSLVFAMVFSLAATAAAISAAAQGIVPALQPLANVAVAFGLGMATFGLIGLVASGEYVRDVGWLMRNSSFWMVTSLVVVGALVGATLSALTAQSFLLHAFENRSTAFRVFLFAMLPVSFGWMLAFVEPAQWETVGPGLVFFLTLLGTAFAIFMVTEQQRLSPRVQAHVPRHRVLACLAAPFLPGRDRGMACFLSYLLVLGLVGWRNWWPASSAGFAGVAEGALRMSAFTAAYASIYLTIGKAVRGRLPAGVPGNHLARFVLPLLLLLFILVPLLVDIFVWGGVERWHYGHAMNPFWTIDRFAFRDVGRGALPWVLGAIVACALLQTPSLVRGVREVAVASAARAAAPRDRAEADGRG